MSLEFHLVVSEVLTITRNCEFTQVSHLDFLLKFEMTILSMTEMMFVNKLLTVWEKKLKKRN